MNIFASTITTVIDLIPMFIFTLGENARGFMEKLHRNLRATEEVSKPLHSPDQPSCYLGSQSVSLRRAAGKKVS